MTQEEKLKEAKKLYESANADQRYVLESLFPELKESEGERTWIINYLSNRILNSTIIAEKENLKKAIDWLEKQGAQKPAPKHRVGDTIYYNSFGELKSMIVANVVTDSTDNPMYEDKEGNAVFEKDIIEQNLTWSEEDDAMFNFIALILRNHQSDEDFTTFETTFKDCIDWFKSLKDRVQPKQVWSEEDEKMLKWLCRIVHSQRVEKVITLKEESELGKWMDKWLNHNPQPHWKPSDGQMETLKFACGGNYVDLGVLESLYNDLKKLKE